MNAGRSVRALFAFLVMAWASVSQAQGVLPEAQRYRLANGLDVVLHASPGSGRVAAVVAYDIGARDEPEGYAQLAHVVEHMTFGGSRHLPPYRGFSLLERAGAQAVNAETDADRTLYYAVVPAKALPLVLWLESERMAFSLERFDDANLELERSVVKNELLYRRGPPSEFGNHVRAALYGGEHPYGRPGLSLADLDDIRLRDVRFFFQQGYRPRNAHLVVVGDFDVGATRALVERYFGSILNPVVPFRRSPLPVRHERPKRGESPKRVELQIGVYRDRLVQHWEAPRPGTALRPAAELLTRILGASIRGALVTGTGEASSVSTSLSDDDLESFWSLEVVPSRNGRRAELEAAVRRAIGAFWLTDLGPLLADESSSHVIAELSQVQDPLATARRHLETLHFERRPFSLALAIERVTTVKDEQLYSLKRYFDQGPHVVGTLVSAPGEFGPEGRLTVSE